MDATAASCHDRRSSSTNAVAAAAIPLTPCSLEPLPPDPTLVTIRRPSTQQVQARSITSNAAATLSTSDQIRNAHSGPCFIRVDGGADPSSREGPPSPPPQRSIPVATDAPLAVFQLVRSDTIFVSFCSSLLESVAAPVDSRAVSFRRPRQRRQMRCWGESMRPAPGGGGVLLGWAGGPIKHPPPRGGHPTYFFLRPSSSESLVRRRAKKKARNNKLVLAPSCR